MAEITIQNIIDIGNTALTDAKMIPLTQGKFAIVDAEDYERITQYKWQVHFVGKIKKPYVGRRECVSYKKYRHLSLHRFILNADKSMEVDHINGDALDNRKCNLRLCNIFQNRANYPKKKNSKNKYKGVTWNVSNNKWWARISYNKKRISLGLFKNEENAAMAYNEAAIKYHGGFARLNII